MMSNRSLQQDVLAANLELAARGLAYGTFGNASGVDREAGVVAIKPSGVEYGELSTHDISIVALGDGEHLDGLRPSSDTPTHLELYRAFTRIGGVAHTHSTYATSWAQAGRPIPCLGTTHADYVYGPIPCTRPLSDDECGDEYERVTGAAIIEALGDCDPASVPAVLVALHGAFTWGDSAVHAVAHAAAVEQIARLAFNSILIDPSLDPIPGTLLDRHFRRKHGPNAYYGQP